MGDLVSRLRSRRRAVSSMRPCWRTGLCKGAVLGPYYLEGSAGFGHGPGELLLWESYKAGSSDFDSKTTGLQTSHMLIRKLIKTFQF